MVYGGIISILIAIWIYRTAMERKTGNTLLWVGGSFVVFLVLQIVMIQFNAMIIEMFAGDVSNEYDSKGGLNARDNSDAAGLQTGAGGTFIGIMFELLHWGVPFLAIAALRAQFMLKELPSLNNMFSGLKEMFIGIVDSFKTVSKEEPTAEPKEGEK